MYLRKLRTLALAGITTWLVAGCGGGYGREDLYVSVYFPSTAVSLFNPSHLVGQQSGFDGHEAHCGLTSGQMAPGMRLDWDCTINGTPTAPGTYSFNFVISAEDTEGEVHSSDSVTVIAPGVTYTRPTRRVGVASSDAPIVTGSWTAPPASLQPAWSYAVASGSLAPGLTLDPTSGVIAGAPTAGGSYVAEIKATLTTTAGSYSPPNVSYTTSVSL